MAGYQGREVSGTYASWVGKANGDTFLGVHNKGMAPRQIRKGRDTLEGVTDGAVNDARSLRISRNPFGREFSNFSQEEKENFLKHPDVNGEEWRDLGPVSMTGV